MNEETAEISVKKPLNDYDKEEYNLILKATQVDNPLRSALSLINIKLVEINMHPPEFESDAYTATIEENSPLETPVLRVRATDRDANRLLYSLNRETDECPFRVDKNTGELRVNGRLDFEMKSVYVLEVLARDTNFTAGSQVRTRFSDHQFYTFAKFLIHERLKSSSKT